MICAGKLDRTITFERKTKTITPNRATVEAWQEIATTRAEIMHLAAIETQTGFGAATGGSVVFRIRWRSGLTTADRVVFEGRAHSIMQIAEIGRRAGLDIHCEADDA